MPKAELYVYVAWYTKNKYPFLSKSLLNKLTKHIIENAKTKYIQIEQIQGSQNHMHCLIKLKPAMSTSNAIKLIKGESAHWVNKHKLTEPKFNWNEKYFAATVSPNSIERVRNYILNPEIKYIKD
ncbi:MAG: IS200/IS605 family transposase [Sphingobacteriia bacterium]|nr:IS200/IS605 family transposase [Sphingobacteriia bacterium]